MNKNDVFAITYAGIGKTGKHEYHIINNNSGSFMTYPDGAPQGKQLTGNVMSPSNDRTRWSVSSCPFAYASYDIVANKVLPDHPAEERKRSILVNNIQPLPPSCGAFLTASHRITPVAKSKMYLNINSGKTDNGTEIWLYSDGHHPSCKWYLRLADDAFPYINCPDVGKGK